LAARLPPDPLTNLSIPTDSLAVARRRCKNKGIRKKRREEGNGKKGKGS